MDARESRCGLSEGTEVDVGLPNPSQALRADVQ